MKNYVLATNSDLRLEAFFINNQGRVMHTYQLLNTDPLIWSPPVLLQGTNNSPIVENSLNVKVVSLGAATNLRGQIQVTAVTHSGHYFLCRQVAFQNWQGWFRITHSNNYQPNRTAHW